MPTLTTTLTKQENDPWILSKDGPSNIFTYEEIQNSLKPYWEAVQALSGLVSISETTDGNVKTVVYTFDTQDNLDAGREFIFNSALATSRKDVLATAMTRNNISPYTFTSLISP